MDVANLQKLLGDEKQWKPRTFLIELFDSPGRKDNGRRVNLMEFCPDRPDQSLKYGKAPEV